FVPTEGQADPEPLGEEFTPEPAPSKPAPTGFDHPSF
ncbi:MAG: hypothetical protein ACI9VR_003839, partial [Cognaticolwellia sp.]